LSNKKQNLIKLLDSVILSRYRFQKYKNKKKKDDINIIIDFDNKKEIQNRIFTLENIVYARDL
jgi:leucyl aminopeptidase